MKQAKTLNEKEIKSIFAAGWLRNIYNFLSIR